ncbi:superoxide dismutase [Salinisphaera orenii MK-B5]|uniref:Superoxide dismutase n=1 Tax=Salinisphaera orenii MK-B5 TaxID=856730 RepID=A0A423PER3_9GAMM|nr:superoxide dismutase family protein [Salinisphaera orenii]ROO24055.1 superoxide dismutase [Salinisphaera orenii MK-B5]
MKPVLTISAAMLLAMSLTACGQNDDEDAAAGDTGSTEATQSDNAAEGSSQDNGGSTDDAMSEDDAGTADSAMSQDNGTAEEDMPRAAVAVLHGTEGNDDVSATIRFTPEDGGLAYTTEAEGLEPGEHGYHIHLYGDCSAADGTSAGTHFNLEGSSKNPPEDIDRITGDLGNLDVGDDGTAEHDGMIEGASLTGAKAIIGRGIIIHEKANDPDQPPIGAAGSRQACGVIGIADPEADSGSDDSGSSSADDSENQSGSGSDSGASMNGDSDSDSSMSDSGSDSGSGSDSSTSDDSDSGSSSGGDSNASGNGGDSGSDMDDASDADQEDDSGSM